MPALSQEESGLANRVWRLEQRQGDLVARLEKVEVKTDSMSQNYEQRGYRLRLVEERMEKLEGTSLLDSPLMKTIFFGLLAMVGALATGQFLSILGLFK